jgi:alpha-tubulin suppressor-like RCC1 family protein
MAAVSATVAGRVTVVLLALALAGCGRGTSEGGAGPAGGDGGASEGGAPPPAFACPPPCDCFRAVATGETLSCALRAGGDVWCWGQAPVGDGTTQPRLVPSRVAGLAGATQIAAGRWHACARKDDGTVWCWGRNAMGQVDDSKLDRPAPVQVTAVSATAQVVAAGGATCALSAQGELTCWGERPVVPLGEARAVELAMGSAHSCFRRADGTVWCLGNNPNGEFGSGTTGGNSRVPVASKMTDATAVDAGGFHTLSLRRDGTVWWWGWDSVLGRSASPLQVAGVEAAVAISAGQQHSCAVTRARAAWCWGIGSNGRLGSGRNDNAATPVAPMLSRVVQISAGERHTCAVLENGPLHCWGHNDAGQLGNGARTESPRPVAVHLACQ